VILMTQAFLICPLDLENVRFMAYALIDSRVSRAGRNQRIKLFYIMQDSCRYSNTQIFQQLHVARTSCSILRFFQKPTIETARLSHLSQVSSLSCSTKPDSTKDPTVCLLYRTFFDTATGQTQLSKVSPNRGQTFSNACIFFNPFVAYTRVGYPEVSTRAVIRILVSLE
jgi:hypothetical protein